jgi:hypothetical protein
MDYSGIEESNLDANLVERQLQLWNTRRLAARKKAQEESEHPFRFLTIARDKGSLGAEVAEELSRSLGWHVFDHEIVSYIARNSHVREDLVRQLDEKSQGLIQDAIARLLRMPEYASFGIEEYHEGLLRTLVYLATHGGAIIVGRGANFALRDDPHGLSVLITSSPEVRARRLSEAWKLTLEEARTRMRVDDEERRKFVRQYFRKDFDDMSFYDLVCNTDRLSLSQTVSAILSAMRLPE